MTRHTCPHYLARSGVCNDPALREEPVTWCCNRWDCATKADARPRHLETLNSIAARGDQYGYRVYMARVADAEGLGSAKALKDAFIASRQTKAPQAD